MYRQLNQLRNTFLQREEAQSINFWRIVAKPGVCAIHLHPNRRAKTHNLGVE
jgi:hypothetical protein